MVNEEETPGSEEEAEEEVTAPAQEAPAAVATDAPTSEKTSELKIVIILKGSKAMLGVQSPDCDPVYKTMEGDLAAVLQGRLQRHQQQIGRLPPKRPQPNRNSFKR